MHCIVKSPEPSHTRPRVGVNVLHLTQKRNETVLVLAFFLFFIYFYIYYTLDVFGDYGRKDIVASDVDYFRWFIICTYI